MKKIAITMCLWAVLLTINAQSKMERDLKIFQTMLEDFINKKESNVFSRKSISVKYYEGFGVIVQMPPLGTGWKHWDYFSTNDIEVNDENIFFSPDMGGGKFELRQEVNIFQNSEQEKDLAIIQKNKATTKEKSKSKNKAQKDHEKAMKEHEKAVKEHNKRVGELQTRRQLRQKEILKKQDSLLAAERKENDEKVKRFLVEYADLLTELKANEKIRVLYSQNSYSKIVNISWDEQERGFATTKFSGNSDDPKGVEVLKSDIDAFKSGKINEKTFLEKIKLLTEQKNTEKTHFEVLAGVLDRLVENTQDKRVVKKVGKTRMFYLEGFGVEYDTKLMNELYVTGAIDVNTIYKIEIDAEGNPNIHIDLGKTDAKDNIKDRADKAFNEVQKKMDDQIEYTKDKLPAFEKELEQKGKEYLLLYGKTLLPFLKNNEKIIWVVDITSPKIFAGKGKEGDKKAETQSKKMTFTLTRQLLEKYDNKQITLEQAVKEVKFEKLQF